ncbi:MAG: hypothetical protein JW959_05200 [Pirellulales bacterium]|nr:hypothetical protein [Pirellulales bacterium]
MYAAPKTPKSFGCAQQAKRLLDLTVKALLTVAVLLAGWFFAREALLWWKTDGAAADGGPAAQYPSSADPLGDPRRPHTIRFGEAAWSLRRREIVGDISNAVSALRVECINLSRNAEPRPLVAQTTGATDDGGLMKFLSKLSPTADSTDGWRLYEFNEAFPTVVGVARTGGSPTEPETDSADLAQLGYRVIMWGIAIPTGADRWSLCIFLPNDFSAKEESVAVDVSLPPGARRTLAVRTVEGEAIVAFAGQGESGDWKPFYDEWFAGRGWRPATAWRRNENGWYAKYVSPDCVGCAVEVHFGRDAGGGLSGLLMIAPPTPK